MTTYTHILMILVSVSVRSPNSIVRYVPASEAQTWKLLEVDGNVFVAR